MKNTFTLCLMAVAGFALAGCKTSGPNASHFARLDTSPAVAITNTLSPDLLKPPTDMFVLGTGDKLDIEMQGNPSTRASVTIGMDGKIYYLLLPGVDVAGLSLTQARERLEKELSRFFNQAEISLSLKEVASKHVWVVGRVNHPGTYPINGAMTLIE